MDNGLTKRELQVLKMLAEGRTSKDTASQLDLSWKTADTHKFNLMKKLGLHSRHDVIFYAIRAGIIDVPRSEHYRPAAKFMFVALAKCGHAQSVYPDIEDPGLAENILGDLRTNQLTIKRITVEEWRARYVKKFLCGCAESGL